MQQITLDCRAKINLSIDVTGRRPNGYHDVEMVMLDVPLFDTVTVRMASAPGIRLESSQPLPCGEENLAYRAAKQFFSAYGMEAGVEIELEKRIPAGAGMAGGSANAAGVLRALNLLAGKPFSLAQLQEIGLALGADVPFCLQGGCVLAQGIGEVLTDLGTPPQVYYVIAKPRVSVSTKWVYTHLDHTAGHPAGLCVQAVAEGVRRGDLEMIIKNAGNLLEQVTIPAYPVVGAYKQIMRESGAQLSLMSGSGSAVFGMFTDRTAAVRCAETFQTYTKEVYFIEKETGGQDETEL